MKQYTTPTITFIFTSLDLAEVEEMRVVLKDETGETLVIEDPEIEGKSVTVKLTQEQTAGLSEGKIRTQCHWRLYDGTADASDEETFNMKELLKGEEI